MVRAGVGGAADVQGELKGNLLERAGVIEKRDGRGEGFEIQKVKRVFQGAHEPLDLPSFDMGLSRDRNRPLNLLFLGQWIILRDVSETEHTTIPVGKGVCGTAVATGEDQNVGDVRGRANYLACNLFTRSELVVLIRRGGTILGQIDVDSDEVDPFTPDEVRAVRQVAEALAVLL